jgi:hypothetical protein
MIPEPQFSEHCISQLLGTWSWWVPALGVLGLSEHRKGSTRGSIVLREPREGALGRRLHERYLIPKSWKLSGSQVKERRESLWTVGRRRKGDSVEMYGREHYSIPVTQIPGA